ncbi:MAG: hypothetical protein RSE94_21465 [Pseudomonas sp.]
MVDIEAVLLGHRNGLQSRYRHGRRYGFPCALARELYLEWLQNLLVSPPAFRRSIDRMSDDPVSHSEPMDAAEAVVPYIPVVLPVAGAVMMFLLAFIAVHMA